MGIQHLAGNAPLLSPLPIAGFVAQEPPVDVSSLPLETKFGEIVGWRAWKFVLGHLISPYTGIIWWPKEDMTAEFEAKDGTPFVDGGGFFSHKTCEGVFEQELNWAVVGTVELWGDVVEHENGYRAQHARIKSLDYFAPGTSDSFRKWLKQEYEQ